MIDLFKVFMSEEAKGEAVRVLESGYIGQGKEVDSFENELAVVFGTDNLVTLNSGTSALHLALHLAGVSPGSEVLSTPLTCFATNAPILAHGGRIRWVDSDPETCNISIDDVVSKVTARTRAIVLVHWGGIPVEIDTLTEKVVDKLGYCPSIIEDCAHCMGALYKNKPVGTFGNLSEFSLQAIKHITSIDGGILILPSESLYKRAKLLRWYGIDREQKVRGDFRCEIPVEEAGYKFHMNDVCATIGRSNLKFLQSIIGKHRENAAFYNSALSSLSGVSLFRLPKDSLPSYWLYTIKVKEQPDFIRLMKEHGITASRVHQRNDIHPCLSDFREELPLLNSFNDQIVCIPVGWWIGKEEREYIVDTITRYRS